MVDIGAIEEDEEEAVGRLEMTASGRSFTIGISNQN